MEQSAYSSGSYRDSRMRPVTIDDLPTEMLWKVFSYLDLKELVSACRVSSRWQEVGNGVPLMTEHEYIIASHEDPSEIVKTLQSIPYLRKVNIVSAPINNIALPLKLLLIFCTDIRDLDIDSRVKIDLNLMQDVVKKFPNLQSLSFPLRSHESSVINQIGACLQLQKLVIIGSGADIDLNPIADGCPNLRYLGIIRCGYKYEDFIYVLKRKKHLLQSLLFTHVSDSQKAPPLSQCTRLERVGCANISPTNLPLGIFLDEISNLSALRRLDLKLYGALTKDDAMKFYKCSFSSTLTELYLCFQRNVTPEFSRTLVSGLPNVEKLCVLVGKERYEREGLKYLLEMKRLQELTIIKWPLCGPLFEKLLECKQIKKLSITHCSQLKDQDALRLVEELKPTSLKIMKCVSLTNGFLKSFPRCETLKELLVHIKDPLEQTVRDLLLRHPTTRITIRKL